jgi:arylsulfatase A-like enzyme
MRNFLTISVLILLAIVVFALLSVKPAKPNALNPPDVAVSSDLQNQDGNILWINLEGLRPDHIGAYGYPNTTTPNIDSLAGESLLFERCYAQSSESFRTVATMLTSEYPGCYPGHKGTNRAQGFRDIINSDQQSLVDIVRESGRTTSAIVSGSFLNNDSGFNKGFDYFDSNMVKDESGGERIRRSSETYNSVESWLSRNFRRSFFLFVQFADPAGPYNADSNFADQLSDMPRYKGPKTLPVSATESRPFNQIPANHGIINDPPPIGEMMRNYDAEIAEVDYFIGKILDQLNRLDIGNNTMIVISSSHGESLGEHGYYFTSGGNVYNNQTHIPLLIHIPGSNSVRVHDVVEGIDIMPTILSHADINPGRQLAGMNLLRFCTKPKLRDEYPAFAYWDSPNMYSIIKGNYELISLDNREFKLFHVLNDPGEIYDLYSDDDPIAQELKRYLETWIRDNRQKSLEREIIDSASPKGKKAPLTVPPKDVQRK